eukprot:scaffold29513_cov41-Prasinocladus_malaysianus.AAC.2
MSCCIPHLVEAGADGQQAAPEGVAPQRRPRERAGRQRRRGPRRSGHIPHPLHTERQVPVDRVRVAPHLAQLGHRRAVRVFTWRFYAYVLPGARRVAAAGRYYRHRRAI